jgi:LPXTG-motif cell wall-anchored protein
MGNARSAAMAATTVIAWLAMAAPAAAHTPNIEVECAASGTVLTVSLQAYGNVRNTVKVQDGFTTLEDSVFGQSFVGSFPRAGEVPHTFTVTVHAADDNRFSFQKQVNTPACVTATPPPPPTTAVPPAPPEPRTTTTTPAPTVSSTKAAPTTTTTPSFPVATTTSIMQLGTSSGLPNTGASIAIPLLVGLCLVSAGGVVLFNRRKRRHAK